MKKRIEQKLISIRPEFDFLKSDSFIDEGLLDSFDLITLVSLLDEEFNISIDGIDMTPENFSNISTIELMLKKYMD
jgi:acyl carrier protein